MAAGVFFAGRRIVTPTTASIVNDDAMRAQSLGVGNVLAIVGKSAGGKPKTPLRFGNPTDAAATLLGGEGLQAVLEAFDPSSEIGGPSEVVFVRVNPAEQATGSIKDSDGTTVINVKSTQYGLAGNDVKFKIEAGSVSGLRVTTQVGRAYCTQDNIGRAAFSVVYGGTETTATIDVTGTSVALKAPAGTAVATLDLTSIPTVGDLVDRINAVAGFTAAVLESSQAMAPLNSLDPVTAKSVKTSATIRADLQAVVDWINSPAEVYLTAERAANAAKVPAVAPWTFLTGGTDGVTSFGEWSAAYEALQSVDVQWVVPVTSDPAVHAMNDAHLTYMSTVGRKERRSICGTAAGTSNEAAKAAAKMLNSDRTSLCFQGHYNYDKDGKLVLLPPYITAAKLAGGFAGVNPGTPLTNKQVKIRGLERELRVPTDTDELIQAGLLCIENTDQGYKVVQSISTWTVNNNYNRVEQSCGWALDFTVRNVRQAVDVLRGQKGNPLVLSRAVSITESTLRELARAEPQGPGVLAGNDASPAYRNIKASLEADVLRIEFECSPVIPVNYVLTTVFAVPFTGTATV